MTKVKTHISIKGKQTLVSSVRTDSAELVTTGNFLKIVRVRDEDYCQGEPVSCPEKLIQQFRDSGGRADIFSFYQRIPQTSPKYQYPIHWDNMAVLPIQSYSNWWENLSQETRRNVRLASKRGLVVSGVPFSDELVRGITEIYNEAPIRQGRKFWHYGKDFETVKKENSTYVERSQFIAAYCGSRLVGFIKMVYVDGLASIMQILSRSDEHNRRPTNALIAKAVEICAQKGVSHLIYCKYVYHKDHHDALTEFKRRNGFMQMNYPRYFVPLTIKGRLAISLKLQLGLAEILPAHIVIALLKARAKYHSIQRPSVFQRA